MPPRRTRFTTTCRLAIAFAALATASGCAVNPVTRRPEVVFVSEAGEKNAGEQGAKQVAAEMGLVEDPELVAYVSAVGKRVARSSPRQSVQYRFGIVDQGEPNAFALPGGYVYISRGLLVLANTEDELANALAHEVIHVAARHHVQRQTRAVGVGILTLGGSLVGSAVGGQLGSALSAPWQALGSGAIAAYGRDQEREADRVGQEIAAKSGVDPEALTNLLVSMERMERLRSERQRIPGFFDTHPSTPERVGNSQRRAKDLSYSPSPGVAPSRDDFVRHLDGLMVGANPREGLFRGQRFLHPDLGFGLRFPKDWKTANSHRAVGAVAPSEDGFVVFQVTAKGDDARAVGASFLNAAARELPMQVEKSEELVIGSLPAFRAKTVAQTNKGAIGLDFTWIAFDGFVYGLMGAAPPVKDQPHFRAFRDTALSFRPLSDAERDSVRETRMRLREARSGETLRALSGRTGNTWTVEQMAVVNGLPRDAVLKAGQLVKVAVEEPYRWKRR